MRQQADMVRSARPEPGSEIRAANVMTRDIATLGPAATVGEAVQMMRALGVHHLPVMSGGLCVGILDGALAAFGELEGTPLSFALDQPVAELLGPVPPAVGPSWALPQLVQLLERTGVSAVPVVDAAGHLLGIITSADVHRALTEAALPPVASPA
jgi:CBS domain-containing protein